MALDGRVLLLNQTYEPLGTVSVARAVIMVFKNTVSVEEFDGDRVLRSARAEFPVPSVIRRRIYINVRRRREASSMRRLRIYMRDKFRCQYCGEKRTAGELTLDHILPRSRGGDNSPVNVVTACVACNNRKGDRTPAEARMPLLTSQSALRVKLERVVLCHYAEARVEWRKYLFMDVYDDRDVRERVERERAGR
ncbi:MAG TPA: HNH endonuclease [Pyrinomonadaceae bacterium]|jgi:5-methylcytosine-specific restriction endonuclease McrA|nr:HNH endonuclease [Pyrinomonadaceae bacterium]